MLKLENLSKRYGSKSVLQDLSLSLQPGEIYGLLGPNGAGKTTTFYMIVGLVPVTRGDVYLDDECITHLPIHQRARRGIGYLPQEPSIFRKLTVEENIRAVAEFCPVSRREREALVEKHLEELHLTHLARQKAFTLSGGERRRLEISRALVMDPKFLFLDEPFSGVDPISVAEVQKMVLALKKRGIGIIITDHSVRETLRIVDRAYLLYEGKVLSEGDRKTLLEDPNSRKFYLGEDFDA